MGSHGFGNYELKRNSSLRGEKENIQDPGDELTADMIDQVEPKLWNRIHSPGIPEIGPIAEDMEAISPHLGAHGFNEDGTTFLTWYQQDDVLVASCSCSQRYSYSTCSLGGLMEVTAEEVVQVIRERFPLHFEIAVQAVQIAKLSQPQEAAEES